MCVCVTPKITLLFVCRPSFSSIINRMKSNPNDIMYFFRIKTYVQSSKKRIPSTKYQRITEKTTNKSSIVCGSVETQPCCLAYRLIVPFIVWNVFPLFLPVRRNAHWMFLKSFNWKYSLKSLYLCFCTYLTKVHPLGIWQKIDFYFYK